MTTPNTPATAVLSSIDGGDMQAVIDCALESAKPYEVDTDVVHHVVVPDGAESKVLDFEAFLDHPRRKRGTVDLHTGVSLAQYVKDHDERDGTTRLFADVYGRSIVAVLNGHTPYVDDETDSDAGWADHRAQLRMRHTPEWELWAKHDGEYMSQVAFAEHVEERLDDIREPAGADLLELAKTFEAKTNIAFRSGIVLESGDRQLTYVESTDARAGSQGQIVIPKEFVLGLAPFEGSDPYRIVARLRYRITEGRLGIGYQLVRAEDVIRAAFADTLTAVEEATGQTAFRGMPPKA